MKDYGGDGVDVETPDVVESALVDDVVTDVDVDPVVSDGARTPDVVDVVLTSWLCAIAISVAICICSNVSFKGSGADVVVVLVVVTPSTVVDVVVEITVVEEDAVFAISTSIPVKSFTVFAYPSIAVTTSCSDTDCSFA